MTAPTPADREREAREMVESFDIGRDKRYDEQRVARLDAYRHAVRAAYRAELRERVEGLDGVRREVEHMRKIADSDGAYLGGWGGQLRASANRAEAALDKLLALLDPEDGTA